MKLRKHLKGYLTFSWCAYAFAPQPLHGRELAERQLDEQIQLGKDSSHSSMKDELKGTNQKAGKVQ